MSEKRRSQVIAAEALATNGRLMDEHFDSLDPWSPTACGRGAISPPPTIL